MIIRSIFTFLPLLLCVSSLNVLFINTWHSKSHARTMMYLAERLVSHGHNVSLYSMALHSLGPMGNGVTALESVVTYPQAEADGKTVVDLFWNSEMIPYTFFMPYNISYSYLLEVEKDATFQRILNTSYDIAIFDEMFATAASTTARLLQDKFGSKIGIFATTDLMPTLSELRGLARNPVISPNYYSKGYRMEFDPQNFVHRFHNVLEYIADIFVMRNIVDFIMLRSGRLMGVPDLSLANSFKMSLMSFIDYPQHFNMPATTSQSLIFTGEHCQFSKPLNDDFKKFVEDPSSKGTIYMAFGSILNWQMAPPDLKYKFLKVFNKYRDYRFIWSYTGEQMENVGEHIMLTPWAPQNDVLAHNKTVLFFTHGGIKSFKEGLCSEVPMLFIPFFADQPKNALISKQRGIAEFIYKKNITEEEIDRKLRMVLMNKQYKEEITKLHSLYIDNVVEPLELGVFYVEKMSRMNEGANKYYDIIGTHIGYIKYFYMDVFLILTIGFYSFIK